MHVYNLIIHMRTYVRPDVYLNLSWRTYASAPKCLRAHLDSLVCMSYFFRRGVMCQWKADKHQTGTCQNFACHIQYYCNANRKTIVCHWNSSWKYSNKYTYKFWHLTHIHLNNTGDKLLIFLLLMRYMATNT